MSRTIRDFQVQSEPAPIVKKWANANAFYVVKSSGSRKTYRKKAFTISYAPFKMMLGVDIQGYQVHLEAWVKPHFFMRLVSLYLLASEMGIESGGLGAALPRQFLRDEVNQLLKKLGQPKIS